jgi:hypothetical protein
MHRESKHTTTRDPRASDFRLDQMQSNKKNVQNFTFFLNFAAKFPRFQKVRSKWYSPPLFGKPGGKDSDSVLVVAFALFHKTVKVVEVEVRCHEDDVLRSLRLSPPRVLRGSRGGFPGAAAGGGEARNC